MNPSPIRSPRPAASPAPSPAKLAGRGAQVAGLAVPAAMVTPVAGGAPSAVSGARGNTAVRPAARSEKSQAAVGGPRPAIPPQQPSASLGGPRSAHGTIPGGLLDVIG